ncbi:tyrosine recombinase XerS [Salsuginibacillus kocurii]|uniref:tyrosine recombinase XerS n=1 Tax=Salsuginibacillus kocurii TaxID=427078 RepID=UPI00035C7CEE|nr:tyrosine recombinase XerS [Salsuginibacillus kocurii]
MPDEYQNHKHYQNLEKVLEYLPWYIEEYIDDKRRRLSAATLMNYANDYKIFLEWTLNEGLHEGTPADVPLSFLESLTVRQVERFLSYLKFEIGNKEVTINRKLSALKSLFYYLQNIAEHRDLTPYIRRNVMAKVELNDLRESMETTAAKMEGKILFGDDYEAFRTFVAEGYGARIRANSKAYRFYQLNRERDAALVALVLGSGLRLSEVVNLNIEDVDFERYYVRVMRKGNKEQYVYCSKQAMTFLKTYVDIRKEKYEVSARQNALFVSAKMGPNQTMRRLTARAVEKMIEKYAAAFGKPNLSIHKLRHSFATKYHGAINDVPKLRQQLGHSSIQTTMIYTHIQNDELKQAVDRMDMPIDAGEEGR